MRVSNLVCERACVCGVVEGAGLLASFPRIYRSTKYGYKMRTLSFEIGKGRGVNIPVG